MFAKIACVIVACGIVAAILLAQRQQRLQAVYEMTSVQQRIIEHDRRLWRLRVEIGDRTTPQRVRQLAERLGPLDPLNPALWELPDASAFAEAQDEDDGVAQ